MSAVIGLTTVSDKDAAIRLAKGLVKKRIAACVNILPSIRSIYMWNDELQNEEEFQLVIKTVEARVPQIQTYLDAEHPYELPELVFIRVSEGSAGYLSWISKSVDEYPE